jgi:hypothetical protein
VCIASVILTRKSPLPPNKTDGIALGLVTPSKETHPMKKTGIAVLARLMVATVAVANEHGGPGGAAGGAATTITEA